VEHSNLRATDGTLSTTLVEDIMSLVQAMTNILYSYLMEQTSLSSKRPFLTKLCGEGFTNCFINGIKHIVCTLEHNQRHRSTSMLPLQLQLEDICATMSDYMSLSESLEKFLSHSVIDMIVELQRVEYSYQSQPMDSEASIQSLHRPCSDLVALYSQDAAKLSEYVSILWLRDMQINSTISTDFFTASWENDWTNNELCRSMIQFVDNYIQRSRKYLLGSQFDTRSDSFNENRNANLYLFQKVVTSSARATICFYTRCLINNKAERIARNKKAKRNYFQNPKRALRRMYDDIRIINRYFLKQCDDYVAMQRIVVNELSILELLYECLLCCNNEHSESTTTLLPSQSSLESFIVVVHKRCTNGNALITRYLIGDLYMLMTSASSTSRLRFGYPQQKVREQKINSIEIAFQHLQPDLLLVSSCIKEMHDQRCVDGTSSKHNQMYGGNVNWPNAIDGMLHNIYEDRMTHGILPVLCNSFCLPSYTDDDHDDNNPRDAIAELFIHPIRTITRKLNR
jgi:hypothetical protein